MAATKGFVTGVKSYSKHARFLIILPLVVALIFFKFEIEVVSY